MNGEEILELSVGEFSRRFTQMIARNGKLQRIAIIGEITEIERWGDGNLNLTLKEGEAILRCFSFGSEARRFPEIRIGLTVRAEGSVEIRANRSLYQLHAFALAPVGEGELAAQIEQLRARLRAEGALDASRKRPVPAFPRRIALVTADGQARADFEGRMRADAPHVEVRFFPSRVQGKGAEIEVADAIDRAAREDVDAIVLTRGGGSSEDRLTFNLEPVVRAILRSRHPVVTALGHLKNQHLADEVADLALATPTAAAVHLAKEWVRAFDRVRALRVSLARCYRALLAGKAQNARLSAIALDGAGARAARHAGERLRGLERKLDQRSPAARVAQWQTGLATARARLAGWPAHGFDRYRGARAARDDRLERAFANALHGGERRLQSAAAALDREDPKRPLERGYAMVTKNGRTLRSAAEAAPGDAIVAHLAHGELDARVEGVRE